MEALQFMILFSHFLLPILAIPTIVTKLIHYQSPISPYFQSNYTDLQISFARLIQLDERRKISRGNFYTSHFDTGLQTKPFLVPLFLVEFNIGHFDDNEHTPNLGFPQLVALDTGSSIFWVNCKGGGTKPYYRRYEPLESTTYAPADCELCPAKYRCDPTPDGCQYSIFYGTGKSEGFLATETFTFNSSRYANTGISIAKLTFGCATQSSRIFSGLNGLLGLGTLKSSIITQLEVSEFSYCIGSSSNPHSTSDVLMIGPSQFDDYDNFIEVENSTPLVAAGHYFVNLIGISFGGEKLDIDEKRLSMLGLPNTILDTGTSLSYLQSVEFTKLYDKIADWMSKTFKPYRQENRPDICWPDSGQLPTTWPAGGGPTAAAGGGPVIVHRLC